MPNTSSAIKQVRVNKRKHLRNKSIRSQVKTKITAAETLIAAGKAEESRAAVIAAVTSLDKTAGKKIIHPNNAARRKSRLLKKLNRAKPSSTTAPPAA